MAASKSNRMIVGAVLVLVIVLGAFVLLRLHNHSNKNAELSGAQLKTALPTQAELPAGWKLGAETDSGDALSPLTSPPRELKQCVYLGSMGALSTLAFAEGQVSYASNEALNSHGDIFVTALGSYKPQTERQPFTALQGWMRQCPGWTDKVLNVKYSRTVTTVPGLGDQNADLHIYPTSPQVAGQALGNNSETLIVRSGQTVVFISDYTRADLPKPNLQPVAKAILDKLQ